MSIGECAPCPAGEFQPIPESFYCTLCPENTVPSEDKTHCVGGSCEYIYEQGASKEVCSPGRALAKRPLALFLNAGSQPSDTGLEVYHIGFPTWRSA